MKNIIAVVGLCGVGKSLATEIIARSMNAKVIYFGGQITGEVRRRGLELRPENEKLVREELRDLHGMHGIAVLAKPEITEQLRETDNVVIDGLYSYAELEFLESDLTVPIATIAIHSPRHLRYLRMANRPVRPLTKEEVDQRDFHEIRALDKATPIALADLHVVNDGTEDDLKERINKALQTLWASIF